MSARRAGDNRVLPGTATERSFDAAIHLASIMPLLIAIPVVGRPHLLIGPFLLFGPFVLGKALAGSRYAGRQHRANAIDFTFTVGVAAVVVYLLLSVGARYSSLSILLPVGAIGLLLLILNWLIFTAIAANRARYGELFDAPWVLPLPPWLRGVPQEVTQ